MSLFCNEKADAVLLVLRGTLAASPGNIFDTELLPGETGSGEVGVPPLPAVFVSIGLRRGEAPRYDGVGELLLTGEDEPFGEPSLLIIVEEIVLRAACFARSVLTKLETRSSRFPLRFGEASSSKGPTSVLRVGPWEI